MSSYFMKGVRDARHPPIQNDDAAFTSIPVDRNDDLTFDKSSSTDHDDDADLVFRLSIARLHGRTSSNTVPRFLGFVKNTLYQTSRCYRRMRFSGPTQWMCGMGEEMREVPTCSTRIVIRISWLNATGTNQFGVDKAG